MSEIYTGDEVINNVNLIGVSGKYGVNRLAGYALAVINRLSEKYTEKKKIKYVRTSLFPIKFLSSLHGNIILRFDQYLLR